MGAEMKLQSTMTTAELDRLIRDGRVQISCDDDGGDLWAQVDEREIYGWVHGEGLWIDSKVLAARPQNDRQPCTHSNGGNPNEGAL